MANFIELDIFKRKMRLKMSSFFVKYERFKYF